jgi:glucose/arabinose dehydrogenase
MPVRSAAPAAGAASQAGIAVRKERSPGDRDAAMQQFFSVRPLKGPEGVEPQVGALITLSNGRTAAAFHHGQVAVYDEKTGHWTVFAEGLHEPLGLFEEPDGALLVMQRPELTRLRDTTGSGKADVYETVWDGFGVTGNYHEFNFGPVRGPNGKLYVGLNLASSGASIRPEIRGTWLPIGLDRAAFAPHWRETVTPEWKDKNGILAGRMYSRVPWRGWILELDPKTWKATPFACGFRSPDGLGFDGEGNLLVSDNQGDWRGTSELHVVKKDGFYGHPASLPWRSDWDGTAPLDVSVERLESLRTPAAIWFPHGTYSNSPTQMVQIPKSPAWGPYGGQLVIGEMNVPRLLRVTLENVNGVWQGACYPFVETSLLRAGLHRLAFAGDKLWVGRTHLSWAGGDHFCTVEPTGKTPMDPLEIRVSAHGFKVRFTRPLAAEAASPQQWPFSRYSYAYHKEYGSPELNKVILHPQSVRLSPDGMEAELTLEEMPENQVYDFDFQALRSKDGEPPLNQKAAYTLRRKP